VVVELMVAEPVEASKRPQERANEGGGFDASTGSGSTIFYHFNKRRLLFYA